MNYINRIHEAYHKFGLDNQEAQLLHKALCESTEPGAQFAAMIVRQIIEHTQAAENLMAQLSTLATEESK